MNPAYVLVHSDDPRVGEELVEYLRRVDESLQQYGATILVQNFPAEVVEGSWDGFITLLQFADVDAARTWYNSDEYQAIRHLRADNSRPTAVIVEGVAEGHRSSDLVKVFGLG